MITISLYNIINTQRRIIDLKKSIVTRRAMSFGNKWKRELKNIDETKETLGRLTLKYAKSGLSKCRFCGDTIDRGAPQVGMDVLWGKCVYCTKGLDDVPSVPSRANA